MDKFINTVASHRIDLDGQDAFCTTSCVPFFYWYENKAHATIRILRFKDFNGMLVFSNLAHGIVDGFGQLKFMSRWSEISKKLQEAGDISMLKVPERRYLHDRSIHSTYKCKGADAVDPDSYNAYSTPTLASKLLAWVSPKLRALVFNAVVSLDPSRCCYFRISKKTVENLRQAVQNHAPDSNVRYSRNDIFSALVTTAIIRATQKYYLEQESNSPATSIFRYISSISHIDKPMNALLMIPVDLRSRIGNPDAASYVGNMIIARCILIPLDNYNEGATPKAMAVVASYIRQAVAGMNKRCIGQHSTLMNKSSEVFARAILFSNNFRYKLLVSNHILFEHYSMDFGSGIPDLVRPGTVAFPNIVFVMPCSPGSDTYELMLSIPRAVRERILQDESWMQLVEGYSVDE
ncbi:hypothetical protein EV175_005234 [Coemansia sp. RSA 1933]|nr:hypothetical protein EV175_005234 [Coemansia sp. RSA 1933]